MTILKCKMCGGSIQITGESHGVCDSCGCHVTLPKIDDDKRANMYNRGNHFRTVGEFDKAASAYEHIIAENPQDAEAHWCLVLSRYGIEYIQDPRSGEYKPTCGRMSIKPIMDDIDYLAALENSDEYTKDIYRQEAKKIYEIQRRYIEILRKEPPYDVFICFKATTETGERTKGSVVAQDIYYQLEKEGVKTFFSRITLENKLGEEYEPYIFSALNSAKVMIVVASSKDEINSRWVKNEWIRYRSIVTKDRSRAIIPVCVGISPYDFPDELPSFQAVDWSKVGASQDLIRGILKITGKLNTGSSNAYRPKINIPEMSATIARAIKDGDFKMALPLIDKILEESPEESLAHFYALLANKKAKKLDELSFEVDWKEDILFKRAMRYANAENKDKLKKFLENCRQKRLYASAEAALAENNYPKAANLFEKLGDYSDSAKRAVEIREKDERIKREERGMSLYQSEVGKYENYMRRRLAEECPSDLKKMVKLYRQSDKSGFPCYGTLETILYIGGIIAIIISALIFNIRRNSITDFEIGLCCFGVAAFVSSLLGVDDEFGDDIKVIIKLILFYIIQAIIVFFISLGILFVLASMHEEIMIGVISITAIILTIRLLRGIFIEISKKASKQELKKLMEESIEPRMQQYRNELIERYEPMLGRAKIQSMTKKLDLNIHI